MNYGDHIPRWTFRFYNAPTLKMQVQFEPRDCWVGLFWRRTEFLHLYICLVPLLPIHIIWWRRR